MSDREGDPLPTSPTVILIGGPMTVDDGSTLDSRQPIAGDRNSEISHRSLATSLLWWTTAVSVVNPILDCATGDPFALVVGPRSVVELRQDGSLLRTRLRSLIPGGTATVDLVRTDQPLPDGYTVGNSMGGFHDDNHDVIGFNLGGTGKRWRFLNGNPYYLTWAGPKMAGMTVLVDTSLVGGDHIYTAHFEAIEGYRTDLVLVVPHTSGTETFFRGYAKWVEGGRRMTESPPPPAPEWDPDAPPDPILYTCPVPVRADFQVTGFVRDGVWQDPSDLEAARSLLQARYDLRIGIWDLAGNATLRQTLLDVVPIRPVPVGSTQIPAASAKRAEARVEAKMRVVAADKKAWSVVVRQLRPLIELGWKRGRGVRSLWQLQLPLTASLPRWPGDEPSPLVTLTFAVGHHERRVSVFTTMSTYNLVDIGQYVLARRATLEDIALPDPCPLGQATPEAPSASPVLWQAPGGGSDELDWGECAGALAARTQPWMAAFEELCDECYRIRENGYASHPWEWTLQSLITKLRGEPLDREFFTSTSLEVQEVKGVLHQGGIPCRGGLGATSAGQETRAYSLALADFENKTLCPVCFLGSRLTRLTNDNNNPLGQVWHLVRLGDRVEKAIEWTSGTTGQSPSLRSAAVRVALEAERARRDYETAGTFIQGGELGKRFQARTEELVVLLRRDDALNAELTASQADKANRAP